jgi:hypothetical protein
LGRNDLENNDKINAARTIFSMEQFDTNPSNNIKSLIDFYYENLKYITFNMKILDSDASRLG